MIEVIFMTEGIGEIGVNVLVALVSLVIYNLFLKRIIPIIRGYFLKVPKLHNSKWIGYSSTGEKDNRRLEIKQIGTNIKAKVIRGVERGEREFRYVGKISSGQLVLVWENSSGKGYIIGAMVLHLSQNLNTLNGKSTYFHHKHGKVVSTDRTYKKIER